MTTYGITPKLCSHPPRNLLKTGYSIYLLSVLFLSLKGKDDERRHIRFNLSGLFRIPIVLPGSRETMYATVAIYRSSGTYFLSQASEHNIPEVDLKICVIHRRIMSLK